MADATFDGDTLLIELPAGQATIAAERELYSAWKEWAKTGDNAKYPLALRTVAGDAISATQDIAPAFFVRNDLGWRINPPDEDIEISVVGNVYAEDDTISLVMPRTGRTIVVAFDRSQNALELSGLTTILEAGYSAEDLLILMSSVLLGKISGGPGSPVFRDINDTKNRVTATADSSGNRTAVTHDAT